MAAARSHVPCVSSPLNPYRQKRACNVARGASSRTCHRNVSISPSEALSRHKASEAWRRCTLSEVREYEGVLDKALMAREVRLAACSDDPSMHGVLRGKGKLVC